MLVAENFGCVTFQIIFVILKIECCEMFLISVHFFMC